MDKKIPILLAGVISMKCNSNIYLKCCKMLNSFLGRSLVWQYFKTEKHFGINKKI